MVLSDQIISQIIGQIVGMRHSEGTSQIYQFSVAAALTESTTILQESIGLDQL
jgi:hypothetical protein